MNTGEKILATVMFVALSFAATADTVLTFSPCAETAQTSNSIPTDVSSPADGDFTWEAWFKPSNLNLGENRMAAQTGWMWNSPGRLDEGGTPVAPVNKVTGVAATNVTVTVADMSRTVGYNQGAGLGAAAYEDDAGLALTPVPAAGTVYTTTAAGGKWSEIAWTPSTPVSGTGAKIVLAGEGAFENDLGTFTLNALTFSATASLSGNGLVFAASGGENPTLATTGAVTNDVNVAMRLDAPLTWTGDNAGGSLRLNGALSGTGDLIHDPTVANVIDYVNGDNSAWSGNIDQRLSFIVVSNSVNLGTGVFYCTNETQRANGRNTLRIYGQSTYNNRFYFGTESKPAARVDIFGNTTFAAPIYVAGTKLGILATVTVNGGISNWNSSATARHVVFTTGNASGRVDVNAPISVEGAFYVNGSRKISPNNRMKVYLNCAGNRFPNYMPIAGGELFCTVPDAYPADAFFSGQDATLSGTPLGGTLDVVGHDVSLGRHQDTFASFTIANSDRTAVPTVRVNQTFANSQSALKTEGKMRLVKDGSQHLQITNEFHVAGTLEVAAGVLRLTKPSEGRLADTVVVRAGATLDLGGNTFACGTLVMTGGTVCNGTLATEETGLGGGTVAATLVGADVAVTGNVAYAASVSAAKTLSTNGLVFYMPFDDAATYLTDEGPDKVVFGRTVSSGTVARDTTEKRFGEGALRLNGSTPLAPTGGNLISGTTFPASVPHGDAPYTVAIFYKIDSAAPQTAELAMLGYGTDAKTQCNNYTLNKAATLSSVAYEAFALVNHWYHTADLWLPLGHAVSPQDGKWHSLVTTWDGSIFKSYDNGIEITPIPKNATQRTVTTPPNVGTTKFLLGSQIRSGCIWKGWLDEIAIFDRAISSDEVLAYHLNGVKGGTAPTQTLTVAAGATATAGHSLTNGLVFHMPFDTAETYLQDFGPDNVTLSCQKTVKHTTLGTATCDTNEKRFGTGSLYLDGKSPLVPDGGAFPAHVPTGAAAYTFACAFKSADASTGRGFIGYGNQAANQCNNYAWNSSILLNNYYWNCDMRPYALASVLDGAWHTLVATWDGNGVWRFWVDGDELAQYGLNRTTYPNVQTGFFWVGATLNGNAWYGWIDELAIWNRALTEEEALDYHLNGVRGGTPTAFGGTARVEVASGGTLKASNGMAVAGTLAAAGTVDGDLTLADGAMVEEQAGGVPSVTGKVTIEGTGSFVPRTYPTSAAMEWTVLTALGGFTAGADEHARTWGIPNLAQTFIASGTASGTTFKMSAFPRGTILIFR